MPRLSISPGLIRARPRGDATTMDLGTSPQWTGIANSVAGSVWLSSWIKVCHVAVNQVLGASGLVRRQITITAWSLAAAQPRPATRVNSFAVDKRIRSRKMSLPTWRSPITEPREASSTREVREHLDIYVGRSFTRTFQFCSKPLHNTPQRVCIRWKRNPLEPRKEPWGAKVLPEQLALSLCHLLVVISIA